MPGGAARLLRRCFQMEAEACPRTLAECAGLLAEIYREELGRAYPRPEPRAAVDTAAALSNQALSFLDLGMAGRAKDLFMEALELDKNHLAASYNLGLGQA